MTDTNDLPRPRRRKSARKKSGPGVLLVCAVLGVVLVVAVAGGVAAVVYVTKARPAKPQAAGDSPPAGRPEAPTGPVVPVVPGAPTVTAVVPPPRLPAGWAYNNPALGFRAAWPVAPAADGFALADIFGNVAGGNVRTYLDQATGFVYSVGWSDLSYIPGAAEIDPLALVDRSIARSKELAAARGQTVEAVQVLPATTSGVPGREIRAKGSVQRLVAVRGKLWILHVLNETKEVNPADPKVATFFDTFAALN